MPDRTALFWAKVDITGDCWLWTAAVDREGYGRFKADTGTVMAHRFAYGLALGDLPDMPLDHLCRVRRCVRPDHLEPVSAAENTRRSTPYRWPPRPDPVTCGNGHPWDEGNEYLAPSGRRYCRSCNRAAVAAYSARKKASE